MRRWIVALWLVCVPLSGPTPASACGECLRDGAREYTLTGTFVRYQRVTFTLHVAIEEGERRWVDRLSVVPMALPEERGELVGWNTLHEGDRLEAVVRESENDRVIVRLRIVRRAA
ncbi:MAG: hypothetical protein H6722_03545 [Sandaracinus sp.]|nr:hypothetical protein [Sandaracinus sp.]MCB9611508.1 hypothetical protein [Sandaracinus sp.]